MEDMLKKLESTIVEVKDKLQTKMVELEGNQKSSSEDRDSIKKSLELVSSELKAVQKQMAERNLNSLPGLQEGKEQFSLQMYVQALHRIKQGASEPWKFSGIEKEALDNIMKKRTVHTADEPTTGGYLIPEEVAQEIIPLADAQMPIMNMGVTYFKGLHGDFSLPKETQRLTIYSLGENEKPTISNAKMGKVTFRKKKIGAFLKITKDLVYQTRGVADAWLKNRLAQDMALGEHNLLLNGKGSDSEPKGILTYAADDTNFTVTTAETNGARFKFDKAATMIQNLDEANEIMDASKVAFLTRPMVKWGLKRQTVLQYSTQAAADGQPIFANSMAVPFLTDAQVDSLLGYAMKTTTHIGKTNTQGTSSTCSSVILGDWSRFGVARWRDFELKVSDIAGDGSTGSAFLDDEFYIVAFNSIDCNFLRQSAFTVIKDCETSGL
jgi:HK97 family phage major capsid protein